MYNYSILVPFCYSAKTFFNVKRADDQYRLSDFTFENLVIKAQNAECDRTQIDRFEWSNVKVN